MQVCGASQSCRAHYACAHASNKNIHVHMHHNVPVTVGHMRHNIQDMSSKKIPIYSCTYLAHTHTHKHIQTHTHTFTHSGGPAVAAGHVQKRCLVVDQVAEGGRQAGRGAQERVPDHGPQEGAPGDARYQQPPQAFQGEEPMPVCMCTCVCVCM
jgi:hypothetical protein